MSTEVSLFGATALAIPAELQAFFQENKNISDRVTVPSLSYEGKTWAVVKNGERTKMTRRNDDGEEETIQTIKVVVLDYAKARARAYYEGAYDPDKAGAPLCYSQDGVTPDASVQTPQCTDCKSCPQAVKGSRITEQGKATVACSQHRMIAVVPVADLKSTALRCKLAITSLYDAQSPDLEKANWFAFENYTRFLASRGVPHTAGVVTKMKFDTNVPYPKVIFSPERLLSGDELAVIKPRISSDEVKSLLDGTFSINGVDGVKVTDDDNEPFEQTPAPKPQAAKPAAKPAPKPAPEPKVEVLEPELVQAATAAEPKKEAKPAAPTELNAELDDILSAWDA